MDLRYFFKDCQALFQKVVQIKKMSKKQCSKVLLTWWNVYSWMVSSFIHKIFPTLSPADHPPKSLFHGKPYAEM